MYSSSSRFAAGRVHLSNYQQHTNTPALLYTVHLINRAGAVSSATTFHPLPTYRPSSYHPTVAAHHISNKCRVRFFTLHSSFLHTSDVSSRF